MREIKFRVWDQKYEIGSDGSIWSLDYNHTGQRRKMRGYLDQDGYFYFYSTVLGKRTKVMVHRIVARLFISMPPTERHQVNHKNGIRNDNRAENLEWVTPSENTLHGWRSNGRKFTSAMLARNKKSFDGVNNPKAKVTHEIAATIRRLRNEHGWTLEAISNDFGICKSQVSAIARGLFWKNPELVKP